MIINNKKEGSTELAKQKMVLTSMHSSQSGIVIAIDGGGGITGRLEALGIRRGSRIVKKSALIGCGPVIVCAGNTEIAIGYGMASRIIIEADEK